MKKYKLLFSERELVMHFRADSLRSAALQGKRMARNYNKALTGKEIAKGFKRTLLSVVEK